MRFILHIGAPKTGTKAIQIFLDNNREVLLERYSILYPNTGKVTSAHHLFPWNLFKELVPPLLRKSYIELDIKELSQMLTDECALHHHLSAIILSSEGFFFLNKEKLLDFNKSLKLKVTDIICYIRRQDLFVDTLYRQNVKYDKLTRPFKEYYTDYLSILKYDHLLSNWKQVFPEAKIIPRIYDRKLFPEGNVILDFLTTLGIKMSEAIEYKIEVNPSLSHLSTLVMKKVNEKFYLSDEDLEKVVQYLIYLDSQEGSPIKTFFTLQERIEFLERFKDSNEKLFRKFFKTENQFMLSEEEIEFYKEQDKIPKEVVEKAVEERYTKVLEFMKANGILP